MDLLEVDVVTGKKTTFRESSRRALDALLVSEVLFAVIGPTALGVRGLPRMTRHLDVVVTTDDAFGAIDALIEAGFRSVTPVNRSEAPEAMYVFTRGEDEVEHFADLARIVLETKVDIAAVERYLAEVHPEMLSTLRDKVHAARNPPPAPPRPTRKRR